MGTLYAYSLAPVLSVALLLGFTALRLGRSAMGLASFCLSVAAWCASLLLCCVPATALVGQRIAAVGAFVCAGYIHVAYDATRQAGRGLVVLAYAVAIGTTLAGILFPGLLYDPVSLRQGPLFWPALGLAAASATLPMALLVHAHRRAAREERVQLARLMAGGGIGLVGAWINAILLSHGLPLPYGMYVVLGSLLLLPNVLRAHESPRDRRLLDRSLLYAAIAALLSAGFLFGVMSLVSQSAEPLLRQYRWGAMFLLFMAALAFEPLRQQLQEALGRRLLPGRAGAAELAAELATQEARADQAQRLAELGAFASAVAHEVRNPLGILSAHLRVLARRGVDADTIESMEEQIRRAERFIEDLLRYGRPRPLELRMVDLPALIELAIGTARDGLREAAPAVEIERDLEEGPKLVEVDQAQLSQVLVILVDNALLALAEAPVRRLRIGARTMGERLRLTIEDSGPGIPPDLLPRLFQPFVTGRKRGAVRSGTGLGLAIARGIVERHGGTLRVRPPGAEANAGADAGAGLGGACFELDLPRYQSVLAAATAAASAPSSITPATPTTTMTTTTTTTMKGGAA
ncbi:MAG TPA: HAMP domain-containing sensor histidine kinase [Polyangia bacterium]|nr:HAMP domain-containing sensor histidine kinase [Polyangia bacterium]